MSTIYAGNPANFPAAITIPSDGDDKSVSSVNPAFEGLADRTASLQYKTRLYRDALAIGGSDPFSDPGGYSDWYSAVASLPTYGDTGLGITVPAGLNIAGFPTITAHIIVRCSFSVFQDNTATYGLMSLFLNGNPMPGALALLNEQANAYNNVTLISQDNYTTDNDAVVNMGACVSDAGVLHFRGLAFMEVEVWSGIF